MKKTITLLLFLLFFSSISFCQYKKGSKLFNVGVGLGYAGFGGMVSGEYGITDDISAGLNAGVSVYGLGGIYLTGGIRGSFHLGKYINEPIGISNDKFDPYLGASAGILKWPSYYYRSGISPYFAGYAGARYKLDNKLTLYGEVGYPYNTVGLSLGF